MKLKTPTGNVGFGEGNGDDCGLFQPLVKQVQ